MDKGIYLSVLVPFFFCSFPWFVHHPSIVWSIHSSCLPLFLSVFFFLSFFLSLFLPFSLSLFLSFFVSYPELLFSHFVQPTFSFYFHHLFYFPLFWNTKGIKVLKTRWNALRVSMGGIHNCKNLNTHFKIQNWDRIIWYMWTLYFEGYTFTIF